MKCQSLIILSEKLYYTNTPKLPQLVPNPSRKTVEKDSLPPKAVGLESERIHRNPSGLLFLQSFD
jgi:hypothetical protein